MNTLPALMIHSGTKQNFGKKRGFRSTEPLNNKTTPPIEIVETSETTEKLWDQAHNLLKTDGNDISFVEPDVDWEDPAILNAQEIEQESRGDNKTGAGHTYIDYWPSPKEPSIWHLDDEHSQLRAARQHVKEYLQKENKKPLIRIAHLDTGYLPAHQSFPRQLINTSLQRNFTPGEETNVKNAIDPMTQGLGMNKGHGTGTLSILAGAKMNIPDLDNFNDFIGLSEFIDIVPIRIAPSVILLKSRSFVRAMDYILNELNQKEETRVHIITMSMGGLPTKAWAQMINEAYEQGVFMVTAAGNNFGKLPVSTLVYPARFRRVVGVCGATFNRMPYRKMPGEGNIFRIMEGNHGPERIMNTAMAAFTPNVAWASWRENSLVTIRGDGTSSATPQVASAAALYYMKYYEELMALEDGWMRVESIRRALFNTADKTIAPPYSANDCLKYFGNGIVQAHKMLAEPVYKPSIEDKEQRDSASFPFLRIIFGRRALMETEDEMMETEMMQLVLDDPRLQKFLDYEEKEIQKLTKNEQYQFAELIESNQKASDRLRKEMQVVKDKLS